MRSIISFDIDGVMAKAFIYLGVGQSVCFFSLAAGFIIGIFGDEGVRGMILITVLTGF